MKFKVILGWRSEYIFDDPDVAMNFAVQAEKARSDDNDDQIRIELVTIKEEAEETEEEEGEAENV